jgi:mono/diheme cytochrome c family protein
VAGGHGRLHWSANFDEVQDFEAQIRSLAGGTGLMADADFNAGTRSQPLGDPKAGVSADLDRLAAYVTSLASFDPSPARATNGALTADAAAGRTVFAARCASCHAGTAFSDSDKRVLHDLGTQKPASGLRLFTALGGIDAPTLRDVWATAPYLHDGSAATLDAAVQAHGLGLTAADLASVVAYTRQIGAEESAAPASNANLVVRAMATLMDRIGALYEVRVNSQVVRKGQLDATAWVDLFIDVATLVRDTIVEVVFKNDASNATGDRNLVVQSIRVNGSTTVASTAPGVVIDAGAGAAAFDGQNTVAASSTGGWMPWDGAMRFSTPDTTPPASTETLVVRALSQLAGGVGAVVDVRVNGQLLATREVANTVLQDLAFTVPALRAGDRVDVVFTNDAVVDGLDRNLYVQAIVARGATLPSTGTEVMIDKGAGAAAFDGLDVVPASSTGGWVPWNAALRFVAR